MFYYIISILFIYLFYIQNVNACQIIFPINHVLLLLSILKEKRQNFFGLPNESVLPPAVSQDTHSVSVKSFPECYFTVSQSGFTGRSSLHTVAFVKMCWCVAPRGALKCTPETKDQQRAAIQARVTRNNTENITA